MQIERKRTAETEACVPMAEDDEAKQLLVKMSKEAEKLAYVARRNLRTRVTVFLTHEISCSRT